jgi:hypothetical protein
MPDAVGVPIGHTRRATQPPELATAVNAHLQKLHVLSEVRLRAVCPSSSMFVQISMETTRALAERDGRAVEVGKF